MQDAANRPPVQATLRKAVDDVDVFAKMIFFKDSVPYTLPDFLPEEFPDQKIPLKRLLYDEDPLRNPLTRSYPDGMIRYFHVPGNDMKWVEVSRWRYYIMVCTDNFRNLWHAIMMTPFPLIQCGIQSSMTGRMKTAV